MEAAVAAGSCRGLYFRLQLHGDHLAIHDWGPGLSSNPYLCFRRLIRGGSRPPDYQETCADIGLGEGEHWSEPLFRESTPARWEEGGAQEPQMGRGGRLTWLQEKDQQLNPKWRPILLKLDRLVSSGTTDEKFLIECWDRPCAPHAGDTGERARVQSQAEAVEESLQDPLAATSPDRLCHHLGARAVGPGDRLCTLGWRGRGECRAPGDGGL